MPRSLLSRMLSVRQPWASFIVPPAQPELGQLLAGSTLRHETLPKGIENRTWPTTYRGGVLIHACGKDRRDRAAMDHYGLDADRFIYGAVLGVVTLVDCEYNGWPDDPWAEPDRWHHRMIDPQTLEQPVSCTGGLGYRHPWVPVIAAVTSRLAYQRSAPVQPR